MMTDLAAFLVLLIVPLAVISALRLTRRVARWAWGKLSA